jgi:hypothetical protein
VPADRPFEKAYEGREHDLAFAGVWPLFDNLRGEPRYRDLLGRVATGASA